MVKPTGNYLPQQQFEQTTKADKAQPVPYIVQQQLAMEAHYYAQRGAKKPVATLTVSHSKPHLF